MNYLYVSDIFFQVLFIPLGLLLTNVSAASSVITDFVSTEQRAII